jgi:hypothetical protein
MTTYTVYPFKSSGVASSLYWIDETGDAAAAAKGMKLLADHDSAVRVTVRRGEALVFSGACSACAAWLAASPDRIALCPAISQPDDLCRSDCGRLTLPGV